MIVAEKVEKKEAPASDMMGKMKVGLGSFFAKAKEFPQSEAATNAQASVWGGFATGWSKTKEAAAVVSKKA